MTDYIGRIIRGEVEKIKATATEKDLIYNLLEIERQLSSSGKTRYQDDYRRALEKAGAGLK